MFVFSLACVHHLALSYHLLFVVKSIQKKKTSEYEAHSEHSRISFFFLTLAFFYCPFFPLVCRFFFYCLPPLTHSLAYRKYSTYFTGSRTDEFHNRFVFFIICLLRCIQTCNETEGVSDWRVKESALRYNPHEQMNDAAQATQWGWSATSRLSIHSSYYTCWT